MRDALPHRILGLVLGWSSRSRAARLTIMTSVELDWLETFLAVVDRGGFTAASSQVHRSQSRVSAHIASLEREIGVRLIDRSHRPATVTEAGRVFAAHAREILADVRTARSAIAAVRALSDRTVAIQTTACIGAAVFPAVLAEVLARFPDASITLTERDRSANDPGAGPERAVLALAPVDREPHPSARRELLWWEPLQLLVPDDHHLARTGGPVPAEWLADERLVLCSAVDRAIEQTPSGLAEGRVGARARLTVDAPQTLAAMVRAGLGVGVLNVVATTTMDRTGLSVLPFVAEGKSSPPGLDVAVDWFDVLLTSPVGRALHEAVLAAPRPAGTLDRRPRP
jgi:DNA-binding transcriptional LysR family regulator